MNVFGYLGLGFVHFDYFVVCSGPCLFPEKIGGEGMLKVLFSVFLFSST